MREEAIDYELESLGVTCEKLRAHPEGIAISLPPLMYKKMMKFKDYPEIAKEYPLILMTGSKLEMYTHSMMPNIPELYEQFPENLLKINPERAAKLEIEDGDVVSDKRLFCGIFIRKVIYLLSLIEVQGCKTQIIFLKAAEKIGDT